MTYPVPASCPDPETLARFVEGTLPRREVHIVLEHIADCDTCTRAIRGASETVAASRPQRKPWWMAAAAALLIAAAAAFVVLRPRPAAAPLTRLVALAPRDGRTVEPRLSGGFPWAPYRGPMRATDTAPDANAYRLGGLTGELLERADENPTPAAQQAAGAALVLVARPGDAVARLRGAAEARPDDATLWNDLGAAEYAAALQMNQPSRYPQALAAFDKALSLDADYAEALFNRALTLEHLGLRAAAHEAWERYLRADAASPWAAEARAHLRRLPAESGDFRTEQPRLERAVASGDAAAVESLVRRYPQASRIFGEAEYLGRWAEAAQQGNPEEAARQLSVARALGDALVRISGESLLRDAVAAIDRAASPVRASLAEAHAGYRRGRIAYSRQNPVDAEPELRRAAAWFAAAGSPMALVARYFAANTRFDQNDVAGALRQLEQLLAEAGAHPHYQGLRAQVHWEIALCRMTDDDWAGALPHLAAAEQTFAALGEGNHRGFIQTLAADALISLGRPDDAWAARIRSFEALSADGWGGRLTVSLGAAARMELRSGRPAAARAISRLELDALRSEGNDFLLANALVRAAVLDAERGDAQAAAATARDAAAAAARLRDPAMRTRALADVQFARGAVLLLRDPRGAAAMLDQAIAAYAKAEAPVFLPESHLLRARAALRLEDPDRALRELAGGISVYERHRVRFADSVAGTGVLDAATALYQEAIRLSLERGDVAAAFAWSESSLWQLAPAPAPEPAADLREVQARLAGTSALIVELALLPEEVVAFAITAKDAVAMRRPLQGRELATLAGAACGGDAAAARELYELLLGGAHGQIEQASRLIVVAGPRLEGVPFAALLDGAGRPLIERLPVALAPAATALRREPPPRGQTVAAASAAFPEGRAALPASRDELAELVHLYPRSIDAGTTFASVVDAARRADVLHISGHSERQGHSDETTLVFRAAHGGEERVTWRHIASASLRRGPVVVLAACETLRAARSPVRRSLSLGGGFLAAGAADVIGTLTPIPDNEARAIFGRIHRHLAAGRGAAEALRLAQLESRAAGSDAWRSIALLTRRIDIPQEGQT